MPSGHPKNASSTILHRAPGLCFKDANVALVAPISGMSQHAGQLLVFCVYKGLLASASPVFKKLFKCKPDEFYNGLPMYQVSGYGWQMKCFLEALLQPSSNLRGDFQSDSALRAQVIAQLAEEYEVPALRAIAVRQVKAEWPRTLEEWDKLQDVIAEQPNGDELRYTWPEPGTAIRFAHSINVSEVLPAAFYSLSRIHMVGDPYTWQFEDGSIEKGYNRTLKREKQAVACSQPSSRWMQLEDEDQACYIKFMAHLSDWATEAGLSINMNNAGICIKCRQLLKDALRPMDPEKEDVLEQLKDLSGQFTTVDGDLCDGCKSALNDKGRDLRKDLWAKLESFIEY